VGCPGTLKAAQQPATGARRLRVCNTRTLGQDTPVYRRWRSGTDGDRTGTYPQIAKGSLPTQGRRSACRSAGPSLAPHGLRGPQPRSPEQPRHRRRSRCRVFLAPASRSAAPASPRRCREEGRGRVRSAPRTGAALQPRSPAGSRAPPARADSRLLGTAEPRAGEESDRNTNQLSLPPPPTFWGNGLSLHLQAGDKPSPPTPPTRDPTARPAPWVSWLGRLKWQHGHLSQEVHTLMG
jgi:hypothetical protein